MVVWMVSMGVWSRLSVFLTSLCQRFLITKKSDRPQEPLFRCWTHLRMSSCKDSLCFLEYRRLESCFFKALFLPRWSNLLKTRLFTKEYEVSRTSLFLQCLWVCESQKLCEEITLGMAPTDNALTWMLKWNLRMKMEEKMKHPFFHLTNRQKLTKHSKATSLLVARSQTLWLFRSSRQRGRSETSRRPGSDDVASPFLLC